jgi:hypothetical protein
MNPVPFDKACKHWNISPDVLRDRVVAREVPVFAMVVRWSSFWIPTPGGKFPRECRCIGDELIQIEYDDDSEEDVKLLWYTGRLRLDRGEAAAIAAKKSGGSFSFGNDPSYRESGWGDDGFLCGADREAARRGVIVCPSRKWKLADLLFDVVVSEVASAKNNDATSRTQIKRHSSNREKALGSMLAALILYGKKIDQDANGHYSVKDVLRLTQDMGLVLDLLPGGDLPLKSDRVIIDLVNEFVQPEKRQARKVSGGGAAQQPSVPPETAKLDSTE